MKAMNEAINHYVQAHPTLVPLLLISYDMFRIYAEAINTSHHPIELLLCDEGHRLKNHQFTKTTVAIQNCLAQRRVIITGTPIQNNLYELYALLQFILPNTFLDLFPVRNTRSGEGDSDREGNKKAVNTSKKQETYCQSLEEFEREYIDKIMRKNEVMMSTTRRNKKGKQSQLSVEEESIVSQGQMVENKMQEILSQLLLRREKEDILKSCLPVRTTFLCSVPPNIHTWLSSDLLESVKAENGGCDWDWGTEYRKVVEEAQQQYDQDDDGIDNNQVKDDNEGNSREIQSEANDVDQSSFANTRKRRNVPPNNNEVQNKRKTKQQSNRDSNNKPKKKKWISILPMFMKLRLLCSLGTQQVPQQLLSQTISSSSSSSSSKPIATLASICGASSKLWFVALLLQAIRKHSPDDKIILASNFQDTLSRLKQLCQVLHCSTLRIDGTVVAEKRNKLVQVFQQSQAKDLPILLLSTRAGGIGLNLTRANHLILCDPDWNPTLDQQTMARIYREGQSKPTFLYRVVLGATLEETMLQRQCLKVSFDCEVLLLYALLMFDACYCFRPN